jgi:hypothetical protein
MGHISGPCYCCHIEASGWPVLLEFPFNKLIAGLWFSGFGAMSKSRTTGDVPGFVLTTLYDALHGYTGSNVISVILLAYGANFSAQSGSIRMPQINLMRRAR